MHTVISSRQRRKLSSIKEVLRKTYHERPVKVGQWLKVVMQGYFNYYAVPGNTIVLEGFRTAVIRSWIMAMRRRSQRNNSVSWRRFATLIAWFIPRVRVRHPYPNQRWRV